MIVRIRWDYIKFMESTPHQIKVCYYCVISSCGYEKSLAIARLFMVEVRRIELLSEKATSKFSPSAVRVLTFPHPGARGQAQGLSSFIMCSCGKA